MSVARLTGMTTIIRGRAPAGSSCNSSCFPRPGRPPMTPGRDRRPLAGFLGACGVSALGTRMSFLALPWLVLTATGSAALTGLVAFAQMAPYVTVQALGGPLVDRLGAWRVSIGTDGLAALFTGLVPALSAARLLSLPVLAAAVAAAGAVRGAGDAARNVMVPGVGELAGAPLERTTGLFDGVSRVAALVGLPLAGVLIAVTSADSVIAIDAGTFAASALLVAAGVPESTQPPRHNAASARAGAGQRSAASTAGAAETSYLASLAEGFRYLFRDRLLVALAAMILITNFVDQAGGAVLFPVWAHDVAHSSLALGLLGGATGLGAVLGNALATWLGPRLPRRMAFGVGFLIGGAPRYLALALAASVSPVLAVAFIGGFGLGGINPVVGAVEYERVPRHLQARVLGAVSASAWAGIPFGSLAGGLAVSAVGLRPALLAAGTLYGVTTLAPFVFPAFRQMERHTVRKPAAMDPA
jgi:MFS transporter